MCYHVATPSADAILEEAPNLPDFIQPELFHVNGFAKEPPMLPAQISEEPEHITGVYWKLIPHWVKDIAKFKANTLNARNDEIFEKSSYKGYIGKNRALLWVSGFYEHQHRDNGKVKVPYFIHHKDNRPFTLGCVYSYWQDHITISIITTDANELMSNIHNSALRMPLIIAPAERQRWLSDLDRNRINDLMRPLSDRTLAAHTVSKDITNSKVDSNIPGIQDLVNY